MGPVGYFLEHTFIIQQQQQQQQQNHHRLCYKHEETVYLSAKTNKSHQTGKKENHRLKCAFFLRDMLLVGGFNPFEKHESNWINSPSRGENTEYLKPPPRLCSQKCKTTFNIEKI